ncbi:hypothetical protein [Actinopolymorpha singaporensis]|uniref:Uncharacterized protein n=1 Tax=Actinopolymorpha singaporensis TaxID=117157 RepID=A0A1H1R1U0_9ACTN|nr:hypothetical protein [Actinopolymorpha singaporensis]SDS29642.1 hypothetical protein SAMN04489717_2240 [Actinopolymorpha singaporensis]
MTDSGGTVRIRRSESGHGWEARWERGDVGSSFRDREKDAVLRWAASRPADYWLTHDPDADEWIPWTPPSEP